MANTLLTADIITKEALRIFENNLVLANKIDRQYDDQFAKEGGKIGATLRIRRPVQYTVRSGATFSVQDVVDTKVDLTVATQRGIDFTFTSEELALKIEEFSSRYIKPAAIRLANEVDYIVATNLYQAVANSTGTPGTTPNSFAHISDAGTMLDNRSAPRDDERMIAFNPNANGSMVDSLKGLFHASTNIEAQYKRGLMGTTGGFDIYMSQNVPVHTVGPLGGTPLVNGAQGASSGWTETASLVTDGWTASAASRLKAGDVFTIANVYAVNQQTKQSTGVLQQFVVTADASSDGSGNLTATISPAPIYSGAYQNINAQIADNAALTIRGTASTAYPQNLAFHKDAFTLVTADLQLPKGVDMASRQNYKNVSMRFVRDYDVTNDAFKSRFDILFGYKAVRPEWANRIWG